MKGATVSCSGTAIATARSEWSRLDGWTGTLVHHTNVSRLRPGHVLIHYANTAIRAIGRVRGWPEERPKAGSTA